MWGVSALQVHGIRSRRLVYKEVVENRLNYNLTSGDLEIPLVVIRLGVTGLKKTRVVYLLDLFEGRIPVTNPSQQSLSLTPSLPIQAPSLSLIAALPLLHSLPSLTLMPKPSATSI